MTLLEEVRIACRRVAEDAGSVRIDESSLCRLAEALSEGPFPRLQMDPQHHYLGRGAETVAFFLILDAVNFGSGYFPALFGSHLPSGYGHIAGALTERFRRRGPPSPRELARLDAEKTARWFDLRQDRPEGRELAALYARSLRELGGWVEENFSGDYAKVVESADRSAEKLVETLAQMTSYRDIARYGPWRIPFLKRAQITAADLHIAFEGKGSGFFGDIDRITLLADNLVPHVLRQQGILRYDEALSRCIEEGQLLSPGSPEEVEIRASTVHAGERLLELLRSTGRAVNALALDNLLWHRGQDPEVRRRPRHLCRTLFY